MSARASTAEAQRAADLAELMALPAFRRFLFRQIQSAGILEHATSGSDGRDLAHAEGRRGLAIDMLRDAEAGQAEAVRHPLGVATLIAVLREEALATARDRQEEQGYDRYAEGEGDAPHP